MNAYIGSLLLAAPLLRRLWLWPKRKRKKNTSLSVCTTGITRTTTIGMTAKTTLTEAIWAKGIRNIANTISKLAETRITTGVGATSIRTMRKIERDRANTARVSARCLATERGAAMDWAMRHCVAKGSRARRSPDLCVESYCRANVLVELRTPTKRTAA